MSPGSPKTFYPTAEFAVGLAEDGLPHKPYILLSGDDDGRMYVLFPNSDARDDWVYQKHILIDTEKTTIGKMAHGDFDGDGFEDVVVAGYSIGQLYLFTYKP
uniref:VCBS repeat-containing protein n=1 Tax=Scylla olivacea TaxID=85551 RepID=A0A0N7ZC19_SCYOL